MQVFIDHYSCKLQGNISVDKSVDSLDPIDYHIDVLFYQNKVKFVFCALELVRVVCNVLNSAECIFGTFSIELLISGSNFDVQYSGGELVEFGGLLNSGDTFVVDKVRLMRCFHEIVAYAKMHQSPASSEVMASVILQLDLLIDQVDSLAKKFQVPGTLY